MVKSEITIKARENARKMMMATGGALPVFITDSARVPGAEAVIRGLPKGAIVICRDYDHPTRASFARQLRTVTRDCGHVFLVAGDAGLARDVGADGVHLPEHKLWQTPNLAGFSFISAACHTRRALCRAADIGVDLALVSPAFPTRSHAGAATLGMHRFSRLVEKASLPVAALGGVNVVTAKKLRPLGLAAFAAIDGFIA